MTRSSVTDSAEKQAMSDWREIRSHREAISNRLADAILKVCADRGVYFRTNETRFHEEVRDLIERYL